MPWILAGSHAYRRPPPPHVPVGIPSPSPGKEPPPCGKRAPLWERACPRYAHLSGNTNHSSHPPRPLVTAVRVETLRIRDRAQAPAKNIRHA